MSDIRPLSEAEIRAFTNRPVLRTQRDEIFAAIQAAELDPATFEWSTVASRRLSS